MPSYTTPGVYVNEPPPKVPHLVTPATTSVAAFIGIFPGGSPGTAVFVTNWMEFVAQFGDIAPGLLATYAVWQFFQNGGGQAWIVPIAPDKASAVKAELGPLTITGKGASWQAKNLEVSLEAPKAPPGFTVPPSLDFVVYEKSPGNQEKSTEVERISNVPHQKAQGAPAALAGVITSQSEYVTAYVTHPGPSADVQEAKPVPLAGGEPGTWDSEATGLFAGIMAELGKPPPVAPSWFSAPALDQIAPQVFNLLCIPDAVWLRTNYSKVVETATSYCQARQAFFLADTPAPEGALPPEWLTVPAAQPPASGTEGVKKLVSKLASNLGPNSYAASVYYPWVQIGDPQGGSPLIVPPSGTVAGVYARTDAARNVWKAPAGVDATLMGVLRLADASLGDEVNGELNAAGINCLRSFPVVGNVVWGARTMAGADLLQSGWKYVPIRRTADFIEQSLKQSLRWAVFEPNGEALWASLRLEAGQFMAELNAQGAFFNAEGSPGYTVACDATTTTEADILAGIVNLQVGFQGMDPAEFVVLTVQLYAGAP